MGSPDMFDGLMEKFMSKQDEFDSLMLAVHGEKNRERDMKALLLGEAAAHACGQDYGPSELELREDAMVVEKHFKAHGPKECNFFLGGGEGVREVTLDLGGFKLSIYEPLEGVLGVEGLPPGWFLVDAPYSMADGGGGAEEFILGSDGTERHTDSVRVSDGCVLVVSDADVHVASILTWTEEQLQDAADQRER